MKKLNGLGICSFLEIETIMMISTKIIKWEYFKTSGNRKKKAEGEEKGQ